MFVLCRVKSTVEIWQNFVPFSEYMNFTYLHKVVVPPTLKYVKFIYSEKVTKFCEIPTVDLTLHRTKICGFLRMYEL